MRRARLWLLLPGLLAASLACAQEAPPAAPGDGAAEAPAALAAEPPAATNTPEQQEAMYQAALHELAQGRPTAAAELLTRLIANEPLHAGAWLELALTQCDLGNSIEAERLFTEIERRFAPPPGIMEVIATHRAAGCKPAPTRPASWVLSAGRGHDSNVNQGTNSPSFTVGGVPGELTSEFLPHPDSYSLLSGSYIQPLDSAGTQAIVQLYARRHDHQSEQDTASLLLGLERAWTLGRWRTRVTGAYGNATLDGKLYQRQQQLQLHAAPPVTLPANLDLALIGNLSRVSYPSRSNFDSTTYELGSTLTYRSKRQQLQLTTSRLRDDGQALRPGGNRDGWFASLQGYAVLGNGLYAEAGLTFQRWRGSSIYARDLVEVVRDQRTGSARAALQWYVQPNLSLYLEGRLVRNRENISLFEYNSRALQLSLRWDNF
jgi:hypothetical protein